MSTTEKTQKPTEVEHADPIDPEKVSISQVSSVSSEKEIRREPPDGGWVAWFVVVGSFCVSSNFVNKPDHSYLIPSFFFVYRVSSERKFDYAHSHSIYSISFGN